MSTIARRSLTAGELLEKAPHATPDQLKEFFDQNPGSAICTDVREARTPTGGTCLHAAILGAHDTLKTHDSLELRDKYREDRATLNALTQKVASLINSNADVHTTDQEGLTPLHLLTRTFDRDSAFDLTDYLITRGAKTDTVDKSGNTLFHDAVVKRASTVLVKMTESVDPHPHLEQPNPDGYTPLHLAVVKSNGLAVDLLVKAGARSDTTAKNGKTVLHDTVALEKGDYRRLELITKDHPHLNTPDHDGQAPLHLATQNLAMVPIGMSGGHTKLSAIFVDALLRAGADRTVKDGRGRTPLHYSAATGDIDSIRVLSTLHLYKFSHVHPSLDFRAEDSDGETPHALAREGGFDEVAELLRRYETIQYRTQCLKVAVPLTVSALAVFGL